MIKELFKTWGTLLAVAILAVGLAMGGQLGWNKMSGIPEMPLTKIVKLSDSQDGTIVGDRMTVLFDEVSGTDNGFMLEQACRLHQIKNLDIVLINPGGNVFLMIDYLDTLERIKSSGVFITTYARGIIASAAVPIFVAGDRRVIAPNCTVMVHPGSWRDARMGGWPEEYDQLFKRFEIFYARYMSDHTNLSYKAILSIMQRDDTNSGAIYWSAEVALQLGFATEMETQSWHKPAPEESTAMDLGNPRHYAKPDHTSDKS